MGRREAQGTRKYYGGCMAHTWTRATRRGTFSSGGLVSHPPYYNHLAFAQQTGITSNTRYNAVLPRRVLGLSFLSTYCCCCSNPILLLLLLLLCCCRRLELIASDVLLIFIIGRIIVLLPPTSRRIYSKHYYLGTNRGPTHCQATTTPFVAGLDQPTKI